VNRLLMTAFVFTATWIGTGAPARALDCDGFDIPDEVAAALISPQIAGKEHEISKRKTLVIHGLESISGSECNFRAVVDVTLKRKIRRDASGTVVLKGQLHIDGGQICISNASVADVDVSNTLNIGEEFYEWVANAALPTNICL
jgi:hypothetical protein